MANTFHDQLSGSDLHDNKVYPATGTPLPSWTQTDARYTRQTRTFNTTAPLLGGGDLSADRTLSMLAASASQGGYLSATDWAAFNGKGDRAFTVLSPSGTNDQARLQATINAATSGDTIVCTAGIFKLSAAFLFGTKKIRLVGAGRGKTIFQAQAGFSGFAQIYDFTAGLSDIEIEGITFDGNGVSGISAIQMGTCQNVTIMHCEAKNQATTRWSFLIGNINDANVASSISNNVVVMSNYFHDNNNGTNETLLAVNCQNSTFDYNYFWNNTNSAYSLNLYGYCKNTSADHNRFRNTRNAIFISDAEACSASHNRIYAEGLGQSGIFIADSQRIQVNDNLYRGYLSAGSGNTAIMVKDFNSSFDGRPALYNDSQFIEINGNHIYDAYYGILVGNGTTGVNRMKNKDILIAGNYVNSYWESVSIGKNDSGVDINNISITGNQLNSFAFDSGAIAIYGYTGDATLVKDINISANKVVPSARANAAGVWLSACSGITVSPGNTLVGTGKGTYLGKDINLTNGATLAPTGYANKTAAYILGSLDSVILTDATSAAFTVTLPSAVGIAGRQYTIKKVDSSANAVTIASTAGNIDGAMTKTLTAQWQAVRVVSDGMNWFVV